MLRQIISGGQTGVDRAALDAAIELGIEHGGWCPKGRLAEDGRIQTRYDLQETNSKNYAVRTERNVVSSNGTLIIFRNNMTGGTLLTQRLVRKHAKPLFEIEIDSLKFGVLFEDWLRSHKIGILNVAGPRESSHPGIYRAAMEILRELFVSKNESA